MRKVWRFLLWTALVIGVVVGIARGVALRWWRIPDGDAYLDASIEPTLHGGDWVLLWRLTKPTFGDLVTCPEPNAPDRVVIGRVVGNEGDHVRVDGSRVYINDKEAESETACIDGTFKVTHPTTHALIEQRCDIEVVGGHGHMRGLTTGAGVLPAPADQKVPPGRLFLLSDNRLLPYDSRDFGLVDVDTCTETVVFRLFSREGFRDEPNRFVFIH
jgi:signal peptidase I